MYTFLISHSSYGAMFQTNMTIDNENGQQCNSVISLSNSSIVNHIKQAHIDPSGQASYLATKLVL